MEFNTILTILDSSQMVREVVTTNDVDGISYRNQSNENLTATLNGNEYNDLLKVCLVEDGKSVKVYLNTVARFNFNKFDLESVLSFSIS